MLPVAIPLARYRFTARMQHGVRLPEYAGSLLRGQFGAALRDVACMTRQPVCTCCPLLQTCPYTRIFEAPAPATHALQKFSNIPNAYVIEPPPFGYATLEAGELLVFHMVLVGAALEQLALVVFAWQRALAAGLTPSRSAAELERVEHVNSDDTSDGVATVVWCRDQPSLTVHEASLEIPAAPLHLKRINLDIHTPMRLQSQGQPLRADQLTARAVVSAMARRVALVLEFHAAQTQWGAQVPPLVELARALDVQHDLNWQDWTRYSSRQKQVMTLGGVMGRWTLLGDTQALATLWPWLWLGQWLHVGKNATMGMGAYTLKGSLQ